MSPSIPAELASLGSVEVLSPLHPSRPREVALVRLGERIYVLKAKSPSRRTLARLVTSRLGHPEIVHEAAVYQAWNEHHGKLEHVTAPRLVFSDEQFFLLLEYREGGQIEPQNPAHARRVAKALVEFHLTPLAGKLPRLTLRQPVAPGYWFVRRLWRSRRELNVSQVLLAYQRLSARQPRALRSFTMHNDLNAGNVLVPAEGAVVLLDFAAVTEDRHVLFRDVVVLASGNRSDPFGLHPALVEAYLQEIEQTRAYRTVCVSDQLRLALLVRVLFRLQFRRNKRRSLEALIDLIHDCLLDDAAYEAWYAAFRAEGRAQLHAQAA